MVRKGKTNGNQEEARKAHAQAGQEDAVPAQEEVSASYTTSTPVTLSLVHIYGEKVVLQGDREKLLYPLAGQTYDIKQADAVYEAAVKKYEAEKRNG